MSHATHRIHAEGLSFPRRSLRGALTAVWLAGALVLGCASSGGNATERAQSASPANEAAGAAHVPQAVVTACYDCHSGQGAAPWNAKLSPSYWFSGSAQKDLDFSDWGSYDAQRRSTELQAIAKSVREGSMPPWDYTLLHPSAKLTDAEKAAILAWTSSAAPGAPR